jgi:hypothetical protein
MNHHLPDHISSPEVTPHSPSSSMTPVQKPTDVIPRAPSRTSVICSFLPEHLTFQRNKELQFSSMRSVNSVVVRRLKYDLEISKFETRPVPQEISDHNFTPPRHIRNQEESSFDNIEDDPVLFAQLAGHCNCKRTKCSKKYCICFKKGRECNQFCLCEGCDNSAQTPKVGQKSAQTLKCNCKKSKCSKRYCECYSSAKRCRAECCCENCTNKEEDLNFDPKTAFSHLLLRKRSDPLGSDGNGIRFKRL